MNKSFIALVAAFAISETLAPAQSIYPDPPPAVLSAAADSFHEYSGFTFDYLQAHIHNPQDQIVIPRTFDPSPNAGVFHPGQPSPTHISHLVDHSDLVAEGVAIKRWTEPTTDNSFTVSIYLVRLTSVAYSHDAGLKIGSEIYVARAGGLVTYKNQKFRGIDPDFHLFHLNEPYIFFGRSIGPNLYKVSSESSLEVHGSSVREASTAHSHYKVFENKASPDVLREAFDAWQQRSQKLGVQ